MNFSRWMSPILFLSSIAFVGCEEIKRADALSQNNRDEIERLKITVDRIEKEISGKTKFQIVNMKRNMRQLSLKAVARLLGKARAIVHDARNLQAQIEKNKSRYNLVLARTKYEGKMISPDEGWLPLTSNFSKYMDNYSLFYQGALREPSEYTPEKLGYDDGIHFSTWMSLKDGGRPLDTSERDEYSYDKEKNVIDEWTKVVRGEFGKADNAIRKVDRDALKTAFRSPLNVAGLNQWFVNDTALEKYWNGGSVNLYDEDKLKQTIERALDGPGYDWVEVFERDPTKF